MTATRISHGELQRLVARLSDRDWAILRFVDQHRFATTGQLRRRFFAAHASQSAATRACVRVLDGSSRSACSPGSIGGSVASGTAQPPSSGVSTSSGIG
jgi:hypothetical protein